MTSVVVTGSRDWPPEKASIIWKHLKRIQDLHENDWHWSPFVLRHGECPFGGVDLIAASWAAGADWEVIPHPPEAREGWAYAKRNKEMIDTSPDYVIAFFLKGAGNRGTQMTYDMAKAAGLKIIKVEA